jgi:hypothetical protein
VVVRREVLLLVNLESYLDKLHSMLKLLMLSI